MTVCRALPLVVLIIAMPFGASAQFGGMPSLPGRPPGGAPVTLPPGLAGKPSAACRQLAALRDERSKHSTAIQEANKRKASVQEVCWLFKAYLLAAQEYVKGFEEHGRACGFVTYDLNQVRERYAKDEQISKQVCAAAVQFQGRLSPSLSDPLQRELSNPGQDYDCRLCGKTGDFWWTVPPPGFR